MFINTTWVEFKDLVDRGRVTLEYTTNPEYYILYGDTKALSFRTTLNKNTADYDAFEANYKNLEITSSDMVTQTAFADRDGHTFDGRGFTFDVPANSTFMGMYAVPFNCRFSGIEILNTKLGDTVKLQVMLPSPFDTVVDTFGTTWNMDNSKMQKTIAYSSYIPIDFRVCIVYTNSESAAKTIRVNLDLHRIL